VLDRLSDVDVGELSEQVDIDYTLGNLQEMLNRSREGLKRIQQIVRDLRDFARLDESDLHEVDLNAGIQSTVNIILGHAKKKQVKIETQFDKGLPPVACQPAKVNQVVMNLLSNAIDASNEHGRVVVRTAAVDGRARIEVHDMRALPVLGSFDLITCLDDAINHLAGPDDVVNTRPLEEILGRAARA